MSQPFNLEQARTAFLREVRKIVQYWDEHPSTDNRQKLEGVAQGVLELIEGVPSAYRPNFPGFLLAPNPPTDMRGKKEASGGDYFPENFLVDTRDASLTDPWLYKLSTMAVKTEDQVFAADIDDESPIIERGS